MSTLVWNQMFCRWWNFLITSRFWHVKALTESFKPVYITREHVQHLKIHTEQQQSNREKLSTGVRRKLTWNVMLYILLKSAGEKKSLVWQCAQLPMVNRDLEGTITTSQGVSRLADVSSETGEASQAHLYVLLLWISTVSKTYWDKSINCPLWHTWDTHDWLVLLWFTGEQVYVIPLKTKPKSMATFALLVSRLTDGYVIL